MSSYTFDPATYLANLWAAALNDDVLTAQEEAVIEHVRLMINAKKSDSTKARKLVEAKRVPIQLTGRVSDWFRNVEDMAAMAIAGGSTDPWNEASVKEAMRLLSERLPGVWDHVLAGARDAYRTQLAIVEQLRCAQCDQMNDAAAKFCANCGGSLGGKNEQPMGTQTALQVPSSGVTLAFAESTASSFHQALDAIRGEPTFQSAEVGRKTWYAATWPKDRLAEALRVVQLVSGWRNRRVFLDGEELEWGNAFRFQYCYSESCKPSALAHYCYGDEQEENPWGCRDLRMPWTEYAEWMQYGRFVSPTEWEFDKQRILAELTTELAGRRLCPRLQAQIPLTAVQLLPQRVRIDGRHWDYREHYGDVPPQNAITVTRHSEWGSEQVFAVGVKPVGREVLDWLYGAIRQHLSEARRLT